MHTAKEALYTRRFCLLALLTMLASFIVLRASHTQRVMAIDTTGTSVVISISGASGQAVFFPSLLTIHIYDTVIFVNQSTTPCAVAADDNSFSSPSIAHNQQWSTTFSILGAHSYHATSATSSNDMPIGEILVVADNVALLPTPQPQIEATALAIIQAGKHPPDVIQLPTTSTTVPGVHSHPQLSLQARLLSFPILAIASGMFALFIFLVLLIIVRFRRKHRAKQDDDEWIDDGFSDMYNTHAYQEATSSTALATLVAQKVQQTQEAKTVQPSQTPKIAWYRRLFQTIQTRTHKRDKDDEDDENYEYEA
ncbi:MAG TPA: hypothetical protein DHW02_17615 [Ktedonobacter sp.]|nr:hypothetical protein [Ktedonobacter sp.]